MDHRAKTDGLTTGAEPSQKRLLALEIRPQEFGFVVLDGKARVMDWGTRMAVDLQNRKSIVVRTALCRLLDFYRPQVIVIGRRSTSASALRVGAAIRAEARRRTTQCRTVSRPAITRFCAALGCNTKHDVALLVAKLFAELSWMLPPKRKAWQSESRHALIFDAAAVAIVFFAMREQPLT